MNQVTTTDPSDVLTPMTLEEAQARQRHSRAMVQIRRVDYLSVGPDLLEMYERGGWKLLGYTSWREYAQDTLGLSRSRVYQLLGAIRVWYNIASVVEEGQNG